MEFLKQKKKVKKTAPKKPSVQGGTVIRKSSVTGFVQVHMVYLIDELSWIKKNTKLPKMGSKPSISVQMVDTLLTWMGMRKKPWWNFWTDEKEWKNWVNLRKDHWLVDHNIRTELVKKRLI